MDITLNTINKKLKHYRRIKNLSQENLAETSGISIRTVQRIESGESVGSAYTLGKLAGALGIDVSFLTEELNSTEVENSAYPEKLKLLNLSALSVIVLPLSNIIFPALILWKNKNNTRLDQPGRRIINFQLLWIFCTLLLMVIVPLSLLLFKPLRGSSIPLFIPVYYCSVMVNVYYTMKNAIAINKQETFLNRIPNIL